MRDFQAFFDLDVPGWQKQMLEPTDWAVRSRAVRANDSVEVLRPVADNVYDELLAESAVFLQLSDATASTTVVECVARATPICVNRVGGVPEYLGPDYPLYHEGNAAALLRDTARVRDAHQYLLDRRESAPCDKDFIDRVQSSAVYISLPTPPSRQGVFERFDVTVLITAYARLHSLREQLNRFSCQRDAPRFELVIWNNDSRNAPLVDAAVRDLSSDFPIRVIHSSENFYCAMRLALPAIARSDVLLICDDDVLPEPHYIRTLYDAHERLGREVAVCVRGHVFHPHRLDLDNPELVWQREQHMKFHDQNAPECTVDFAHADNFVISMDLLRRASLRPMTHPEYVLVDDYWLSYVLSAEVGVSCRKIQAPEIFRFTESADDPNIALYHNPSVHEQRVRLYVEHMLAGWPKGAQITLQAPF
ncbi:MAG: glycosyltransferase [Alphaproteobacteria bacterium]|nr:glycosyltransferase [Alphaproteobacteria bacterium]